MPASVLEKSAGQPRPRSRPRSRAPRSEPSPLLGDQTPRILYVPEHVSTAAGREAIDLAGDCGLQLDPWQQLVLEHSLAERADGKWAAFEVGLVVARQNGKGSILEARELAGLFLFDERVVIHSAHLFETSLAAYVRLLELIESNPWADAKVKRKAKAHGEEGIELKNGCKIRFKTRTAGGGRGLTGDLVVLDEAMILNPLSMSALMPTMAARSQHGNPQLWYTGSAGEEHSEVFGAVRRRGLAGTDPALCFIEWSVDEAEYSAAVDAGEAERLATDPRAHAQSNPGMGIRISAEHILREQRSMLTDAFAVERLSVGRWPEEQATWSVISKDQWDDGFDPDSTSDLGVLGFDITPNGGAATVVHAGKRDDGATDVEVLHAAPGTGWCVTYLAALATKHKLSVVLDPASPAGAFQTKLEDAGVTVIAVTARDVVHACLHFYTEAIAGRIRHRAWPALNTAVGIATKRDIGDGGWGWARKGATGDISPLVAATLAAWSSTTTKPARTFWGAVA